MYDVPHSMPYRITIDDSPQMSEMFLSIYMLVYLNHNTYSISLFYD